MNEIESKYLVEQHEFEKELELGGWNSYEIEQGYLFDHKKIVLRVRRLVTSGGVPVCTVTFKAPLSIGSSGVVSNTEHEFVIDESEFKKAYSECQSKIIKTRLAKEYQGKTIEVDMFGGDLSGLILAEVEFDNIQDFESFQPPSYFAENVSDDTRYSNAWLSRAGEIPSAKNIIKL